MLTPTDVHLLVGVFSKLTTPDNVDIMLGEMVYDEAAKRKRDIDISIRYKNASSEEVLFVGLQVKDHSRKLGSPEVEQLCLHFMDSKAIQEGGIVSASGFTGPAINKAAYHNIDLYEFRDWDISLSKDLPHVRFGKDFKFEEVTRVFKEKPNVTYIFDESLTADELASFHAETRVLNSDGTPIPRTENISHLNNNFINRMLQIDQIKTQLENAKKGDEVPINATLNIERPPVAIINGKHVNLKQVNIQGIMKNEVRECATQFKILTKLDNPDYQVGSAICELSNGLLIGPSTSNVDKSVKMITIPVADRVREKIHQMKIK